MKLNTEGGSGEARENSGRGFAPRRLPPKDPLVALTVVRGWATSCVISFSLAPSLIFDCELKTQKYFHFYYIYSSYISINKK